ncbi:hypothetical protein RJT34_30951 [Clitoria ternatea]|uniref:FAS1 domain-containing protein n=1 Tax=Clitoria ternatea TaxID=43366 RepID=A0AAN9I0W9_CLITE
MAVKKIMALFFTSMLISSVTPADQTGSRNVDLVAATREMQKANYFTFVMLINMSPSDPRLEGNVTFLMPNDRMLANMVLQEGSISDFLLRHSIPSPLLFGVLEQFPTGTTIPSSLPNCMLRISNNGRKNYVVNNVKLISPNICVAGSSIRCHGIDGVLSEACTLVSNYSASLSPKSSPMIPSPSPTTFIAPSATTAHVGPHNSGSLHWMSYDGSLNFVAYLIFYLIGIYF